MKKSTAVALGTTVFISAGFFLASTFNLANAELPTQTETPIPTVTDTPTPTETPLPVPVDTSTPTPVPSEPTVPMPTANTVLDAVVTGITTYCHASSSVTVKANWQLWDPNAVQGLGYWEVAANSYNGMIVLHVTPEGTSVLVEPSDTLSTQAFSAWNCPSSFSVLVG
jgi:hypothetical protein